jgi:hypothetical protein
MLCAGPGRYRIGFAEIDPPPGQEPDESAVEDASRQCWENSYYNFTKPAGTSLVCIQGEWSNVVDGKIKGRLAAMAARGPADNTYVPLYARAACAPRPWGVTALFAEHTGHHAPLEIDWPLDSRVSLPVRLYSNANEPVAVAAAAYAAPVVAAPVRVQAAPAVQAAPVTVQASPVTADAEPAHDEPTPPLPRGFPTFWALCLGVNRRDAAALAIAGNGASPTLPVEGAELRKLLGTVWFRSVFAQLSQPWRERLLDVLVQSGPIANRVVRSGRRTAKVSELAYEELKQVPGETILPEAVRADVQLLIVAGALWGPEAIKRFAFEDQPQADQSKGLFSFVAFR